MKEPGVFPNYATVKSNPKTQPPLKSNPKTKATNTVKLDIKSIVSIIGGWVLGYFLDEVGC